MELINNKMRISLIGPVYPYRGGISHFNSRLAQEIIKSGHEIQAISFSRQYPAWLYPGKSDKDPSNEYLQVDASYMLDPIYPWTWVKTLKEIKSWNPDIVLIEWWTTFWAPAFAYISHQLKKDVKIIFLIHNVLPHEAKWFDSLLAKLALNQANKYIVQVKSQREKLQQLIPDADPIVVEHPLYDQFSKKRMDKKEARRMLGLPQDSSILLFFGIVRPYKGLSYLIKSLALVYQKGYSPLLIVAGEFWENIRKYQHLIDQLKLYDKVIIHNRYIPNEEVGLYFSAADAFIAPYVNATQSGVIKIALTFGLPVIISQVLMSEELNNPSYHLYQVIPQDVDALAITIEQCLLENKKIQDICQSQSEVKDWNNLVTTLNSLIN